MNRLVLPAAIALCAAPAIAAAAPPAAAPVNDYSLRLETMVVTAHRQPVPLRTVGTSVSLLDALDIRQRGYSDISDLLRTLPSIYVSNSGGPGKASALRIRGEEGFRTLILLDGVDISDPSSPQVGPRIEYLLTPGIERVEVLRGPQGLMYGADAGGVVQLFSRRAEAPLAVEVFAETGSHNSHLLGASLRGRNDFGDFSFTATDRSTDAFNARTVDSGGDKDGYDNRTLHLHGGINPVTAWRIEFTVRDVDARADYDGAFAPFDDTSRYDQRLWRLKATQELETFRHSLAWQRSTTERSESNSSYRSDYEGVISEWQYQGVLTAGDAASHSASGDLVFGVDLEEQQLRESGDTGKQRDQYGVYAEWQGAWRDWLFYTLGARHDDNDDFGEHTSYRASLAYLVPTGTGSLKLKGSYGTGFRAPSLYEVNYNRGPWAFPPASTTSLQEEKSRGGELGIEHWWHSGAHIELVWFHQQVEDVIDFDLASWSGYLQTAGKTRSQGVELSGSLPLGSVAVHGSYTYNDTEAVTGGPRLRRPRHLANLGFSWNLTAHLQAAVNWRTAQHALDQLNGVDIRLDDYQVLDATLSWQVTDQLDLYLRGENLLDDDYEEVATHRTAGATIYGGLRWRLF
ncbi:MAG: TonB-dependent receptor [Spongiibacteraceae bacterium]|nr:TonB-dependent receptor [Spongiibacteraceae bacterium]